MLGFGSFGRVVSGLNLNTGELMAVKQVVLKGFNVSTEKINALQIEIELLKQLKHKNIVRYIGSSQGKDVLNIFLEYVAGGSIASLLNRYGPFKEKLIRVYTKQILEGLEYLHANRLIHRDIKGANVLITTDAICKLADFGSAKKIVGMNETEKYQSLRGTAYWMAPEVIRQSGHGRHADIWSVGCTVLEMATGKPPWSEIDNQIAAMFHIAQTESLPAIPAHLSPEAKDFLKCCFRRNPLERPNVCKLLKHPFIVGDVARSVPRELRLPVGNADLQFNSVNSLNSAGSSKGNGKAYNTMNAEFKSGNSTKPSEDEKEFRSAPTNHSKLLGQLASSPELLQFQSSNGISPVFAPQPIPYQPQSATLAHKSKDIPTRPVEVKSRYARDPKDSIDPKRSVKDVDLLFGEEKGLNSTQFEVLNEVFSKLKEADQPKGQNDPMSELMSPNIKADADRFAGRGVEAGPEQNGMKQSNINENKIDFQNYYYSNKNYFPDPPRFE
eukprot:TRINITY_DN9681_c0_g1_i1.p1 TRINITY_DN9681_c0_g1~~TRINITY_DN9681_c0_g1_i1.p1  ORF type:complete len:498 (-),score=111.85 TRINITY_DN9681_c0_g1_i1:232-1725(-)